MITARLRRSSSAAMMLLRTKRSRIAKVAAGSFGSALRSPTFLLASATMSLRRFSSRPAKRAQPAPEIVVQHQRPAAEQLLRQELREHAVSTVRRSRRCGRDRRCCRAARTPRWCRRNTDPPAATPTAGTRPADPPGACGRIRRHCGAPRGDRIRGSAAAPELVAEAGQVLQLADGLLGLAHAFRGRVHLAAEEVGILPVDRHLGERLDLALDPIELDGRRTRRSSSRLPKLSRRSSADRDAVLQRPDDAVVVLRSARPRGSCAARSRRVVISCSFIVLRKRSSAVRDTSSRRNSQSSRSSPGVPDVFRAAAGVAGARRGRRPRSSASRRQRACSRSKRARSASGKPPSMVTERHGGDLGYRRRRRRSLPRRVDLGVDRRAEPRNGDQSRQVGQLAGADERQQHVGKRRQHRGDAAADEAAAGSSGRETPPPR